jgi:SAM-dependent methyltransferase
MTRFYDELAGWWPLISPREDYAEEAEQFLRIFRAEAPGARAILELGSGGGHLASYLKEGYAMTLVDLAPRMLDVSRELNPECEHVVGDMRDVRLGRHFDLVFIHDAIMYMTTEEDLRKAMITARAHSHVVVIAPDCVKETYVAEDEEQGIDGDGRAVRYLEWTFDPDPDDTWCVTDYVFALREGMDLKVVHDRHVTGLFPRATWLRLLGEAGFDEVRSFIDPWNRDIFIASRSDRSSRT